jgi:hypothetical protein
MGQEFLDVFHASVMDGIDADDRAAGNLWMAKIESRQLGTMSGILHQ